MSCFFKIHFEWICSVGVPWNLFNFIQLRVNYMCMHRNVLKHKTWAITLRNFNYHSLSQARLQIEKKWMHVKCPTSWGKFIFRDICHLTLQAVSEKVTRPSRSWFLCVCKSFYTAPCSLRLPFLEKIIHCCLDYIMVVWKSSHYVLLHTILNMPSYL